MSFIKNLASYYTLDGNVNDSLNVNNGTQSSVTFNNSYGVINQGANFVRGTSGMNTVTSTGFPSGNVAFTVSGWANLRSYNQVSAGYTAHIFDLGTSPNNVYIVISNDGVNPTVIAYGTDTANRIYTPATFSLGTWYHYVLTYDGTTLSLYINGTLADSATKTISVDTSYNRLNFGSNYFNDASTRFDGYLDEFGIWTRCLTSTEASQLYNSGKGLAYSSTLFSLISYYAMEGNGTDSSGLNDLGTANVTYNNSYGIVGKGMNYVRNSSQAVQGSSTNMPKGTNVPFTISAWGNLRSLNATYFGSSLFQMGVPTSSVQITIGYDGTNRSLIYGTGDANKVIYPFTVSLSTWYHFAITYDGTTASLYINGTLFDSAILSLTIDNHAYSRLNIGADYFTNLSTQWDGYIDEVGAWGICLTATQVAQLYNNGSGLTYPFVIAQSTGRPTKNYIANSISI